MNKKVLDEVANWMFDAVISKDSAKFKKLEKLYSKMFDRQWKYYKGWKEFLR